MVALLVRIDLQPPEPASIHQRQGENLLEPRDKRR